MKRIILFLASALILSQCGKEPKEGQDENNQKDIKLMTLANQYVVILKEKPILKDGKVKDRNRKNQFKRNNTTRKIKKDSLNEVFKRNNIHHVDTGSVYTDLVVGFKARLSEVEREKLEKDIAVEGVYPDFEIRLRNPIQQSLPIISRNPIQQDYDFVDTVRGITCAVLKAGGPVDAAGKSPVVWILDTGVQLDHPDLNVEIDPELAISFIPGETDDGNGHGTHIAGIIGAKENLLGATGVSAGARVVPVKILENSGSGRWSYLLSGLEHVARYNNANDVVNLSLGAYGINLCKNSNKAYQALKKVLIDLANDSTFVVIAAGNEGKDADNSLPGCIDNDNIFTVSAMNCDSTCADYSNFGKPPVDWIAVGSNVFSTYKNSQYRIMSGTSMAAAIVSGVIHARGGPPVNGDHKFCGILPKKYYYAKTR